jgi:hypothetical protein
MSEVVLRLSLGEACSLRKVLGVALFHVEDKPQAYGLGWHDVEAAGDVHARAVTATLAVGRESDRRCA